MCYTDVRSRHSLPAIAVLALAIWIAIAGLQWAAPTSEDVSHHGPHALSAAYTDPAVATPHSHLSDASSVLAPSVVAEAVLPRVFTALAALGVVLALAAMLPLWRQGFPSAVRGPPRESAHLMSGRVLLTRLCIARR